MAANRVAPDLSLISSMLLLLLLLLLAVRADIFPTRWHSDAFCTSSPIKQRSNHSSHLV